MQATVIFAMECFMHTQDPLFWISVELKCFPHVALTLVSFCMNSLPAFELALSS